MSKSAVVAGGTGLVGSLLIKLLNRSRVIDAVKVLVRKESHFSQDGVSVITVEYDRPGNYAKDLMADVIFCCLGTTIEKARTKENFRKVDYAYPLKLAEIAKQNNCSQFNIITSAGASANSLFFYNKMKGEIERAISELELRNLNIFRPSLLLGERKEKRFGELAGATISRIMNPFMVGSLRKYRAIQSEIVARAMAQVAVKESTGYQIIESDMIQTLGEAYVD